MKAAPHPDKGGPIAPVLLLPAVTSGPRSPFRIESARERATVRSLITLFELQIYVERQLAAGPYDDWDAQVLAQWRDAVKDQIRKAEWDLRDRVSELEDFQDRFSPPRPEYEIVEQAG